MTPKQQDEFLRVYCLDIDLSDSDISVLVQKIFSDGRKNTGLATITINGYGRDKRSLWHIPEVKEFCKKLCSSGLLHTLAPATNVKEVVPEGYNGEQFSNTFGALEIWLISLGYKLDDLMLTIPMMEEFLELMENTALKYKKLCDQVQDIDL